MARRLVAEVFVKIAETECATEVLRQVLAENAAFETYSLFRTLDRLNVGYLTAGSLVEFLRENNVSVTEREGFLIVKEWGGGPSGRLKYSDLASWVLPKQNPALKVQASQREGGAVLFEVKYSFLRILDRELSFQREIEALRQKVSDPLNGIFQEISEEGTVSRARLQRFVESEIRGRRFDAECVMRRLDKDLDGKLSFFEFFEGLNPVEPFHKLAAQGTAQLSPLLKQRIQFDSYKISCTRRQQRTFDTANEPFSSLFHSFHK